MQNVRSEIVAVQTSSLLEVVEDNRGLFNPFTNVHASAAQASDLLNFRKIGQEEFLLDYLATY